MDTAVSSSKKSRLRPLLMLAAVALVVLVVAIDMRRRSAEAQLAQLSLRLDQLNGGDAEQNKEIADKVVLQLRALIDIPEGVEPTVATIVDVNVLRERNPFYNKAKNGDYLVVTSERAILFDANQNKILDVVPVQLQQADSSDASVQ